MKKLLSLFVFVLAAMSAWADFTQGNFTYSVNSDPTTVSVKQASTEISGDLVIPATVTEGSVTYTVTKVSNNGKIAMAEALVRWIHPDRGIIAPGAFIPLLEKTGYIYKLDMYIWEQAVKRLAYWNSINRDDVSISVNISVKDFYYVDLFDVFTSLVEKYRVDPKRIKLEITESIFMTEKERQIDIINSLKEYGFLIEIDDFGSGYSSLNMLKEVPADILKMDMAFLSMDKNASKGRKIINTIITLAKALGMLVIIEGVENKEQLDYLSGTGADYLQGYYFDKPLPVKKFEEYYLQ